MIDKFRGLFRNKAGQQRQRTDNLNASERRAIENVQSGSVGAYDRCGRQLQLQDDVIYDPPNDLIFKIMAAAPVLDRNAPRGLVQLTLVCTVPVNTYGNMPDLRLTLVARNSRWLVPEPVPKAEPSSAEEPSRLILP